MELIDQTTMSTNNFPSHPDGFEMMLDVIPSAVIYIGKDRRYHYVNRFYAGWLNLTPADIIGKHITEIDKEEVLETTEYYRLKALAGENISFETEIFYPSGRRDLEITYTPDKDEHWSVKGFIGLLDDITEKKTIEKELKLKQVELESQRKGTEEKLATLAAIVHSSDDAIISKTLNGIVTSWNDAAERLFGYKKEEIIGKNITQIIPADRLDEERAILEQICKGERVDHFETVRMAKDGRLLDISLTISPVKDSAGKIIGASKISRDITQQKRIESQVRETEERFRMAVESTRLGTWEFMPKTKEVKWSQECRRIYDVPDDVKIDYEFFASHLFPEDAELAESAIADALKPRGPGDYDIHYRILRYSDKQPRWIQAKGRVFFDESGNPERFIGTVLDITDEKTEEQQLKSSIELFRNMADNTPVIIWITSNDGFCTYLNKQWYDLTGQTPQEALGFGWLDAVHDDERKNIETTFLSATKHHGFFSYEYRLKMIDGSYRWMLGVGSPKFSDAGDFEGFVGSVTDIHERRSAEEKLRESEERLRMSVQSTNLGIWEYHLPTQRLIWSDECKKIYGLPLDHEPEYNFIALRNHPEDAAFVQEEVGKTLSTPGIPNLELQYRIFRVNDDQLRWLKIHGRVVFNKNKEAVRFIGTMLDITEEKIREQHLVDSVELFRTMADNVPAMIWMSGTDKFCDFFNNTWLEFTGRTLEEERNDGWLQGVHPDDVQKCRTLYGESFAAQKGFAMEYRLRRRDGEYRWVSDNSVPRYSPEGSFAGFISACIDIDDQKLYREKILESELLFKTISNASPAALWMTDKDEKNVFVSDTWLKWTGGSFEQQINRGWIHSLIDEDKDATIKKFKHCFNARKYFNTEFRFLRTDGEMRWGFTEGYPFFDINGQFAGYAGSVTDITEIKKLEQRKDDFIKMASHELKTPITSINGYVQLLLNIYNEADDDKLQLSKATVKSSLGTIAKQVSKLTRLVTELLDLSRIETGKLELRKTEFDLAALVAETVQDVRYTASKHAIIVENDFEGMIYADKDRIAQVLLNLLTNAIKYSPDADHVEVSVTGDQKSAIIKVCDHGIGIDKKEHHKIFERFYRAEGKNEQTFPGFGIGLFIASEIVQRHYGTIGVKSEKGNGSEFIVTLPVKAKK
jgi:PAS domain S-box-containing protein